MYHKRSTKKIYASYPKREDCDFCDASATAAKAVRETKHAYVIPNRTSYDHWETRKVEDHLMIVPKAHVETLAELSDEAKIDIMTLMGEYESGDYNIYARAATSQTRSIKHQHTHLIRTGSKAGRAVFYIRKPYFLFRI